jgi:beta-N-acetylhexosaminidase
VTVLEAQACGINAIGAPDLDVNVNPANPIINTRAFGGDPDLVCRFGTAFLDGVAAASSTGPGVVPIGKHFPGHGDTHMDSHLHLETLDQPRERLESVELPPFRQAILSGIPMLMTAHVAYPALDPDPGVPATLSHPILTDLLRGEMGFRGALVTDCMNMHAIARNFEPDDAAIRCVAAGCDLVMTDQWDVSYHALYRAMKDGRLSEARVHEASDRVRAVKEQIFGPALTRPEPITPELAQVSVGTPANAEVAERIAAASITLVSGTLVPPTTRPLVLATRMARRFGPAVEVQVRAALSALGWHGADVMMLDPTPDAGQIDMARERAAAAGWAALLHFNRVQSFDPEAVLTGDELVGLTGAVAETGVPMTVVSMGSPYACPLFSQASTQMCTYSTCDASVRALLRVLLGVAPAPGRIPCEIAPASAAPAA